MKLELQTEPESFRVPLIHKKTATKDINKSLQIAQERLATLTGMGAELDEPISVCKMSHKMFLKYCELFPSGILYEDECIKMWEFPLYPHGDAGGSLHEYIRSCTEGYFASKRDQACPIGENKSKTSDDSFIPREKNSGMVNPLDGKKFPTIVIEIAGKGQGIKGLRRVVRSYFNGFNDVQIVLGLKVSEHSNGKFRVVFMIMTREMDDIQEFEIGEVGPNRQPLARERLPSVSLPFNLAFYGAPIPANLTDRNEFLMDLNILSEQIFIDLRSPYNL